MSLYTNDTSAAGVSGHPLHAMLVPFPITCFVGAFATDLAYWSTADVQWETFSIWLITVGLVFGVFAMIAGAVDFGRSRRAHSLAVGWVHALGNLVALGLSLVNAFVHSRDGYTAVVPQGLLLSGSVVLILFVTGWLGHSMVYRHRIGGGR